MQTGPQRNMLHGFKDITACQPCPSFCFHLQHIIMPICIRVTDVQRPGDCLEPGSTADSAMERQAVTPHIASHGYNNPESQGTSQANLTMLISTPK